MTGKFVLGLRVSQSSPVKSTSHLQTKLPGRFKQFALIPHGDDDLHSLISTKSKHSIKTKGKAIALVNIQMITWRCVLLKDL